MKTFIAIVCGLGLSGLLQNPLLAETPSFDCASVKKGSIESLVCDSDELSVLDKRLATVYEAAMKKAANGVKLLKVEQRGWISGRNECWKNPDKASCVKTEYQRRIAELQARYQLISPIRKARYECEKQKANEVVVSYFTTTPPTMIAERGDTSYLLYRDGDTSTSLKEMYRGRNEEITVEGDNLEASFSYQGKSVHCLDTSMQEASARGRMHPSWDKDQDGVNDCENDGSCDHTIDYTRPAPGVQ